MCIHETIQLSQDGERVIYCGDCGREFGHIMRDERESFVAWNTPESPAAVILGKPDDAVIGVTATELQGAPTLEPVYPCRKCGFRGSCDEEDGGCHS